MTDVCQRSPRSPPRLECRATRESADAHQAPSHRLDSVRRGRSPLPRWPRRRGPTGEQIVAKYVATQEVDSEVAYVELSISQPGSATRKHRFLTVYRKRPDGTRDYLLRMVAPKDVAGVSVLAHEDRVGGGRAVRLRAGGGEDPQARG